MYETFYGLRAKPFSLLPDPAYLYQSRKHQLALSLLEYAVHNSLSISVVTGEVGSGKTTLVRQLLNQLGHKVTVGLISNTHRSFGNLMQWVALAFDLPFKDRDKVELYHDFVEFLCREYARGKSTLLIVDEAQNLDPETLEELRLLSNVNADDHQVLQMLLVGQPELHALLKRYDLRQLAQRISVSYRLEPLDEPETAAYVRHRVAIAGGRPNLFHKNALRLIYSNSGGIPRVINTLCDLALVYGYADRKAQIDAVLIADIARDRVDMGLYGDQAYDVSSLTSRPPAGQTPAAPVQGGLVTGAELDAAAANAPAPPAAAPAMDPLLAAIPTGQSTLDLIVDGAPEDGGELAVAATLIAAESDAASPADNPLAAAADPKPERRQRRKRRR